MLRNVRFRLFETLIWIFHLISLSSEQPTPAGVYVLPWHLNSSALDRTYIVSNFSRFVFNSTDYYGDTTMTNNLVEVTQDGYLRCDATSRQTFLQLWSPAFGAWTFQIDIPSQALEMGRHYFICTSNGTDVMYDNPAEPGEGGNCLLGMRVIIEANENGTFIIDTSTTSPGPVPFSDRVYDAMHKLGNLDSTDAKVLMALAALVPLVAVGAGVFAYCRLRRRNRQQREHYRHLWNEEDTRGSSLELTTRPNLETGS